MTHTVDLTAANQISLPSHTTLLRLQDLLVSLDHRLRDAGIDEAALADLEAARILVETTVQTSFRALIQGAPTRSPGVVTAEIRTGATEAGAGCERMPTRRPAKEPTPMAVHALGTLRVAANACTQWDRERGIVYGLGKVLTGYATATRDEVFGPSDQ